MPATNYTHPAPGAYGLVRIRGKQAEIMDPQILDRILGLLELSAKDELFEALYRSQPFHSTQTDPSGEQWRGSMAFSHPDIELPRMFPWAVAKGHVLSASPDR